MLKDASFCNEIMSEYAICIGQTGWSGRKGLAYAQQKNGEDRWYLETHTLFLVNLNKYSKRAKDSTETNGVGVKFTFIHQSTVSSSCY